MKDLEEASFLLIFHWSEFSHMIVLSLQRRLENVVLMHAQLHVRCCDRQGLVEHEKNVQHQGESTEDWSLHLALIDPSGISGTTCLPWHS